MLSKSEIELQSQSLIELPIAIIWLYKNKIVFINNKSETYIEHDSKNNKKVENLDSDSIFNSDSLKKIEKIRNTLLQKKSGNQEIILQLKHNKNGFLDFKTTFSLIKLGEKNILQLLLTPIETNNAKKKGTQIDEDTNRINSLLHTVFETSNQLIWVVNKKFELTAFNKNFSNLIYDKYKIKIKIGHNISQFINKDVEKYIEFWHPRYNQAFEGQSLVFIKEEIVIKYICRQIFINPIFSENRKINEICCVAHDITDSTLYERKVNSQKGRLTAIFDSSQHYIWTIDREEKLTSFNKNYFDLITNIYNTQPYLGLNLDRGVFSKDKQYLSLLKEHYQSAFAGETKRFEVEIQDQENKTVFLEIFLNPIYEKDEVVEVSGIAQNITDKKMAHQKMEISLKEKEVLLKEVHHRVKNNMQVISSILNLQSFYVTDNYALSLLKESQNRISTMAYIHESLYMNSSFSSVNFSEYVKKLVRNIVSSYSAKAEKIKLKQNISEIALSLDYSIPLGLIINELITNSIKHAFPDKEKGTITISLKSENNFVFLDLMDDGIGLPEGFNIETSQSLGLQLVSTLIEQIDAKYQIKSSKNKGTTFNISFQI